MENHSGFQAGFRDGYNAALNDRQREPHPSLVCSLAQNDYLQDYVSGYDEGYTQGTSDRRLLLQGREQTEEWHLHEPALHERDDV